MGIKRGVIQSRGLGDIIIALPIARYYYEEYGDEIIWPICREFYDSVVDSVPWVQWRPIDTDPEGLFFLETPLRVFEEESVDPDEALYLYQFLSSRPDLTDPELFNILKFDQYKYQAAGVPFRRKWQLSQAITRDLSRETLLGEGLGLAAGDRYAVVNLKGSNFAARIDLDFLDPAVRIIDLDSNLTASIFDWITVLESAEAVVCVDSALANLVDQLSIEGPELYWIRRSPWDLTPVQGSLWRVIPTDLPIREPQRVDPAALTRSSSQPQPQARQELESNTPGGMTSQVPFQTRSTIPTNFMHAVANKTLGGASSNLQGTPRAQQQQPQLNPALNLYKQLGVKF